MTTMNAHFFECLKPYKIMNKSLFTSHRVLHRTNPNTRVKSIDCNKKDYNFRLGLFYRLVPIKSDDELIDCPSKKFYF